MNPSSSEIVQALLREQTGRKQAVLAGRASAAIWAALRARSIEGRIVLMPANICYIVAWTVLQSGNVPYLVDIDPSTGNISLETVSQIQAESPAALVACHMYGLGAPIAAIAEWAMARGIFLIEDAALALGAVVDGRPAGSWGDVSVFSFGAGKIVDHRNGGALLCDDGELAQKIESELEALPLWSAQIERSWDQWTELYWLLHQYEQENPQVASVYPEMFRLYGDITRYRPPASHWDSVASPLASLDSNLHHRCEMASLYDECFRFGKVQTLARPEGSILWRYPLLVAREDRDALLDAFWDNDIPASRWYPPLNTSLAALSPTTEKRAFPGAEQLGAEIINLPVDHTADGEAVKRSAEIVQTYFRNKRTVGRSFD